ncbi:MAG: peptide deformylase [Rhodoluna sp.]
MIRPIVITGDPVLHTRALEVTVFDENLRQLVEDMYETMDAAPGVGLAAPQIGVPLRVFVYDWDADDGSEQRGVVINPVLEVPDYETSNPNPESESEGCLSVPGERFPIRRSLKVTVTGVDLEQNPVKIEAEGWFARIFQHEFDHLNGTLYVDRLIEPYNAEAKRIITERGWGKPSLSWQPGKDFLEG